MSDTENKDPNKDKFKDSVFLPKTEFPMRGNLPEKEPAMVQKWQEIDLYGKIRKASKGKPKWILHDGPPYANGNIHMGHALNKILKDVINKSWQMLGYDAPYVPGWDCHGLPIEWKVEEGYREKGQDKDAIDKLTFREECRQFAQKWVDTQSEQFQRLGVIGDWKDPYLTMTKHGEAQIVREIHKFALNGGLYKGLKPVMWSTVEKTALAEAEVEYKEHKSITIWVKFPVVKAANPALNGANVVIWTTTPWTMPSNRGIACGEDIDYGVYEVKEVIEDSRVKIGDKLVLANKLADDVKEKAKITILEKLSDLKGSDIIGTVCAHPLRGQGYEYDVPVLQADFVEDTAGTGFVHIAPSHGADDFMLGKAAGLEITDNVTDDG
ncbi:MAG TPA: class I tRNA ligase family protein, partial [Alphaproteobacteria bacterium]|nr:class I tRNA ligase family protein [Alphaproteobacteria bacterium]